MDAKQENNHILNSHSLTSYNINKHIDHHKQHSHNDLYSNFLLQCKKITAPALFHSLKSYNFNYNISVKENTHDMINEKFCLYI